MNTYSRVLVALFCMFAISCSLNKKPIEKDNYVLMVKRQQINKRDKTKHTGVLKIRKVSINPFFDQRSLIYQVADYKFKADFYNEYLVDPEDMFANLVRQWLVATNLFESVAFHRGSSEACYYLDITVEEFYFDLRRRENLRAVLTMDLVLTQANKQNKLYYHSHRKEMSLANDRVATMIIGQNALLQKILEDMEADLQTLVLEPCIAIK